MSGLPKVRDDLAGLVPYGAPQLDVPVRLNTNETPYQVPEAVMDELADGVRRLGLQRYPDREALALRTALAARAGHPVEGTWAANGSNEVIQQLLQAYGGPGRSCLVVEPTYAMHTLIARATGTRVSARVQARELPLGPERAAALVAEAGAEVTFWCSPNNPTGEATGPEVLDAICQAAPGLVVLDEAYGEFGDADAGPRAARAAGEGRGPQDTAALLGRHANLAVTRTFSKAFRLAGARVGYVLADPAVIDGLRLVRLPYHLSALTQLAAEVALAHADALTAHVAATARERDRLAAALGALPGVHVLPSQANFLAFALPAPPSTVWRALLDRGVLVRDISSAPTLDRHLRVTVGTPDENEAFLAALAGALEELQP